MKKHGMAPSKGKKGHPLYYRWLEIKGRCNNPRHKDFKFYGARGIRVHEEWENNFLSFLSATGEPPFPSAQLDRIDNDKGYEPGNVRWIAPRGNTQNRRSSKLSKTGVVGVEIQRGKYRARIWVNGKFKNLGTFSTIQEAIEARRLAELSI